jgi:hypothetical protein
VSLAAQELAYPAIILPIFIALALLLAVLLRRLNEDRPGGRSAGQGTRPTNILAASWFPWLVALLMAGGMFYAQRAGAGVAVTVDADMMVGRGNLVELFLNDPQLQPYRASIVAGQRHVYRFENLPHKITLLRLDPTEAPNSQVVIYGLTVMSGNRVFRQFTPAEMKDWTMSSLTAPKEEAGGIVMTSTTNDPILWTHPALRLPGAAVQAVFSWAMTTDGPFVLAIAMFLLVLLMRMSTRAGRMQAVLIAVASCAAFPAVLAVMRLRLSPPPVTATVGYASYTGYAKANETLASFLVLLICVALGYLFARWTGGQEEAEPAGATDPTGSETVKEGRRNRLPHRLAIWITHAAVFVLLFIFFLPSLPVYLKHLSGVVYRDISWDSANTLLWSAMVNKGLRPYRDFWYPYGGFYIDLLRFPTGQLLGVLHSTVLLGALYIGLFRVAGRRLVDALVLFGLILTPLLAGMTDGWHRYLLPIVVVLFYAAICDLPRLEWKAHAPFAVVVGYACFCEPPQMVCAGAAICAHVVLSSLRSWNARTPGAPLQARLIGAGVPMLAGIGAAVLFYGVNGMLPGLWDFEKSVGDMGDYGALPAEMPRWVLPALQPDSVFLLVFLLAGYAAYRWVRMKGPDPLGAALLMICVSAFVALQKQIIRPHVMQQVRIYPYVAVMIFGLIVWRERRPAARIAIAIFIGLICGIGLHHRLPLLVFWQTVEVGPEKVSGALEVVLHERQETARVNDALYSRPHFATLDEQTAVVDNLTGACGLQPGDNVYVLGDDSYFYIFLNQAPPYGSNDYNDTPIYEQQKILDWFHGKDPRFVIWGTDPAAQSFDFVPHVVRLPLIYKYVVDHYRFLRAVGNYHILVKRTESDAPDVAYWRRMLGARLDLGHIPGRARSSEYAACAGQQAACDTVMTVRYPRPRRVPRGKLEVTVESSGNDAFRIELDVAPGEREYVVNLNRVWFWGLVAGAGPRVTVEDDLAETVIELRRERGVVLY